MTCVSLAALLLQAHTRISTHALIAVHLVTMRMDDPDDSLQRSPLARYFRRCMDHPRSLRRCTILRSGLQKSHSTSGHTMDKWRATMTRLVRMSSCRPGFLVDSPKTILLYSFPLTAHNYIATKHLTAGCLSGSSIIFALDYVTQNGLSSQEASFPDPINHERSTPIYSHHSTISLLYNAKG